MNNDLNAFQQMRISILTTRKILMQCPDCGYDGSIPLKDSDYPFHYVVDLPSSSRILGSDGTAILVDCESTQHWNSSNNGRIDCGNCAHTFTTDQRHHFEWV